jgi:hypothetical protein
MALVCGCSCMCICTYFLPLMLNQVARENIWIQKEECSMDFCIEDTSFLGILMNFKLKCRPYVQLYVRAWTPNW